MEGGAGDRHSFQGKATTSDQGMVGGPGEAWDEGRTQGFRQVPALTLLLSSAQLGHPSTCTQHIWQEQNSPAACGCHTWARPRSKNPSRLTLPKCRSSGP